MAASNVADIKDSFTVACLHRVLSRSVGVRGLPPPSLISRGIALVSVTDAARLGLYVTQNLRLTSGNGAAIASAWPSSWIEPGYIALDDATLYALGIPPDAPVARMSPATPRSTPSKSGGKKSSAKKNSSKKKRGQNTQAPEASPRRFDRNSHRGERINRLESSPTATVKSLDTMQRTAVCLEILPAALPKSKSVELDAPTSVVGPEVAALAKRELQGRVVIPGSAIALTILGVSRCLRVHAVHPIRSAITGGDAAEPAVASKATAVRIVEDTSVKFARALIDTPSSQKKCTLAQLGGLDQQGAELLALARTALGDPCEKGGVLIHGPAGTGKSTLARAIAAELNTHIEEVHGAAVYAGGAEGGATAALQEAFARAAASAPSVLVLDDLDVFARRRGASLGLDRNTSADDNSTEIELPSLGHDLARLLDDLISGTFVIATTSHPDAVDPALRRPGRLSAEISLEVPDAAGRAEVLRALSHPARTIGSVSFSIEEGDAIARAAYGCVSADLAGAWGRAVARTVMRNGAANDAVVTAEDVRTALQATTPSALRAVAVEVPKTLWADVGGQDAAKAQLREAVELPLSDRGRAALAALNLDPPRGILLYGPPGCSKTLLARAVATESKANFVSVRGPELLSKWVGASERAVREVFRRARAAAPVVVFFDEIDALAGSRDGHAGASAHSRVVAQLLAEMDGVGESAGVHGERVVVIAATNRPDLLDRALLRPGRIDVQIFVGLPDRVEREAVLRVHTRKTPLAANVDVAALAYEEWTGGMSGAEVAALVREAALAAMEEDPAGASVVQIKDFKKALSRVSRRTTPEMVEFFERYREKLQYRSNL